MVTRVSDTVVDGHIERQFEQDGTPVGLDFDTKAGLYVSGVDIETIAADTVTLANNTISLVWLDTSGFTIGSGVSAPASDFLLLYRVTTSGGSITAVEDLRAKLVSKI